MADPQSADEWLALARQHEASARALCVVPEAASQALFHVGLGVEAALKGCIMAREGLNQWPDRKQRAELFTHDLTELLAIAKLDVHDDDAPKASLHVVLQWDRSQGYDPKPMPHKVATAWVEAGFGVDGVVGWLKKKSTRHD